MSAVSKVESFRDLKVWRRGIEITLAVYRVTADFPDDERFGLTSQLRRCATSIPSNAAEGHARKTTKEFLRFISIATGSLAELQTQLTIADRLGYLPEGSKSNLKTLCDEQSRMLTGLRNSLRRKLKSG